MITIVNLIEQLRDRWARTPGDTRVALTAAALASPIVATVVLIASGTPSNPGTPFTPDTPYPTGAPASTTAPFGLGGLGGSSSPTSVRSVPSGARIALTAPVMVPRLHAPGAYFADCSEARAAGRSNIPRGDPAYRAGLDRGGNGIACEADGADSGPSGASTRAPSGPLSATESASAPVPDPPVTTEPAQATSGPVTSKPPVPTTEPSAIEPNAFVR